MPTVEHFLAVINVLLAVAQDKNDVFIDINAGELHKFIGRYPNNGDHRMPQCNAAMRQSMQGNDEILQTPPRGQGAKLTIRYFLPRI